MSAFLKESGISNINLHGEISLRERKGKFRQFQNEEEIVLICTSLASRGLDTKKVRKNILICSDSLNRLLKLFFDMKFHFVCLLKKKTTKIIGTACFELRVSFVYC